MAISANNYSKALFHAIHDDAVLDNVKKDFSTVMESVRNVPAFHDFISNPRISRDERRAVIDNTFKDVEKPLHNMLLILSDKGKMTNIENIYEDFIKLYNAHFNQAYVVVESVYKLSGEELDEIGKAFIRKTGLKKLLIENEVNEDLIGGIRVFIDTKVYDASIRGQLNTLRGQFKAHANS
jgi:ATP synthase F1 delta subunit